MELGVDIDGMSLSISDDEGYSPDRLDDWLNRVLAFVIQARIALEKVEEDG